MEEWEIRFGLKDLAEDHCKSFGDLEDRVAICRMMFVSAYVNLKTGFVWLNIAQASILMVLCRKLLILRGQ